MVRKRIRDIINPDNQQLHHQLMRPSPEASQLENQCDDSREKAYHSLMRELFSMKAFCDTSSQDELISKAQDFGNKIDNRITDFIIQVGEGKKEWLGHRSIITLHQVTIMEIVVDLLNDAENKGPDK
ncbi:hypothetical protein RclHR1_29100002 [Rhizophagus clarus]|uniref:Uncharacterized protein n=1 Tax=Rhizophagus clarus TaxID=94130 RepID=A0A2Z6RK60_9GLOM|nr:hypothetical protein RclHR1_29100002 [Rhizophagus clarus]GES89723.1 hypothetical protein GLOIN_2v1736298 [Rhizophagus clarus]